MTRKRRSTEVASTMEDYTDGLLVESDRSGQEHVIDFVKDIDVPYTKTDNLKMIALKG